MKQFFFDIIRIFLSVPAVIDINRQLPAEFPYPFLFRKLLRIRRKNFLFSPQAAIRHKKIFP